MCCSLISACCGGQLVKNNKMTAIVFPQQALLAYHGFGSFIHNSSRLGTDRIRLVSCFSCTSVVARASVNIYPF